jgi:hypothetical protein
MGISWVEWYQTPTDVIERDKRYLYLENKYSKKKKKG